MASHFDLSDIEFEHAFEACQLQPALFTHEAHLRLAWIHVRKYGVENAINNVTSQLKKYVSFLGAVDKYNETVTIAAIKGVHHFMLRSGTRTFPDFISENSRLNTHFKHLLSQHYTGYIFTSEKAKKSFQEPDLLPFD